ncbi:Uncharacterized protein SCG7086_AB_00360 [Chlamydiales bacterium SCGC AG-110-P3]|nr:Uncharacterized protein SCG7086_AB_00360 [Chlamydiales bacterium SCGC AG-110-P3]
MSAIEKTKLVFTRKVVLASTVLGLLAILLGIHLATVDQPDVTEYYELLASSQANRDRAAIAKFTGRQERKNIRKTILFSYPEGRRALRLASDESDLVFDIGAGDGEIVEHLRGVTCDMQEELYYQLSDGREALPQDGGRLLVRGGDTNDPSAWIDVASEGIIPMQRIRHVDADSATYYYKRDLFAAESVSLTRFFVGEHVLSEYWDDVSPTMQGLARAVQFSMAGNDPSFKAYHLKLTLFSKEGLL